MQLKVLKAFQTNFRGKRGNYKMEIFIDFLIFVSVFLAFNWLMKKSKIQEKLFKKAKKSKYYNFIVISLIFVLMFLLEYGKQYLYEFYGKTSWLSIGFAGILGSIYVNCIPYMFKKKN